MNNALGQSLLHILAGVAIGVVVGSACAWHSETLKAEREELEGRPVETKAAEPPDREPWLRVDIVDKNPPTRLHLCLFFGAWGGVIGMLLAAGGKWPATLACGVLGGVAWLFLEQAAVGMMANRGFSPEWEPRPILISFMAFLAASAAAVYTSMEGKKVPKKKLREPV